MELYILCDSTNGDMSLSDVYTGTDYEPNPDRDEFEDLEGHTLQVAMGLLRHASVLDKGYMFFCRHQPDVVRRINCAQRTQWQWEQQCRLEDKETKLMRGRQAAFRQRENLAAVK